MAEDVTKRLENLDFHHPFEPYDVQLDFMRTVYNVLDTGNGQVGILESPTGTVSPRYRDRGTHWFLLGIVGQPLLLITVGQIIVSDMCLIDVAA